MDPKWNYSLSEVQRALPKHVRAIYLELCGFDCWVPFGFGGPWGHPTRPRETLCPNIEAYRNQIKCACAWAVCGWFIPLFIHSSIHPSIHPCIHSCMNSLMHSCIHVFMLSCIHAVIRSINQPTNQASNQSIKQTIIHSSIHSCLLSFSRSKIYTYVYIFE